MDYLSKDYAYAYDGSPTASNYWSSDTTSARQIVRGRASRAASNKLGRASVLGNRRLKIVVAKSPALVRGALINVAEFSSLVRVWRQETLLLSSPSEKAMHPAYQRIIALGAPALPLVIEELRAKGGQWFWALRYLANHDPVPQEHWGNVQLMKAAWLHWWDEQK